MPELSEKLPKHIDLDRLRESCRKSRESLHYMRRMRKTFIESYVGPYYSEDTAHLAEPIGLVKLYVQVMSRALIPKEPRVEYDTHDLSQLAAVDQMQAWVNEEIKRSYLADKLRRWVFDGLFADGFVKVALASPADAAMNGWNYRSGVPVLRNIDLDDIAFDMHARCFEETEWVAHRVRIPVWVANELWAKGRRVKFEEEEEGDYNLEGDERLNTLARGTGHRAEFEPRVTVWEVFFRNYNLVVTLFDDGGLPAGADSKFQDGTKMGPLAVQKWIGPPCGPIHKIGFGTVPDNVLDTSPVAQIYRLNVALNRAYMKLIDDAENYKEVIPYRGSNVDDHGRLKQAVHGEFVQYEGNDRPVPLAMRVPQQGLTMFCDHMRQTWDFIAGNIALLGGRAPSSRTLGQDKMLNENASAGVADMQGTVISKVNQIFEAFNWYYWYHPEKVMESKKVVNNDYTMSRRLYPYRPNDEETQELMAAGETVRKGQIPQIKLDVYSLAHMSPQMRSELISGVVREMAPFMQMLQAAGIQFDLAEYLEMKSRLLDEPSLKRIFRYNEPPIPQETQPGERGQPEMGPMPNEGGEYTRISVGQESPAAKGADLQKQMMAAAGSRNGEMMQ